MRCGPCEETQLLRLHGRHRFVVLCWQRICLICTPSRGVRALRRWDRRGRRLRAPPRPTTLWSACPRNCLPGACVAAATVCSAVTCRADACCGDGGGPVRGERCAQRGRAGICAGAGALRRRRSDCGGNPRWCVVVKHVARSSASMQNLPPRRLLCVTCKLGSWLLT